MELVALVNLADERLWIEPVAIAVLLTVWKRRGGRDIPCGGLLPCNTCSIASQQWYKLGFGLTSVDASCPNSAVETLSALKLE